MSQVATQEPEESAVAFKVSKTSHNSRTKHYFIESMKSKKT